MGILDVLGSALESFQETAQKKASDIEKRASRDYREKARSSSDAALYYNLEQFEEKGNYVAVAAIREEMERRGLD